MVFENVQALLEYAKNNRTTRTVAVAGAAEEHTLLAVMKARREGIVHPLVGNKSRILELLDEIDEHIEEKDIHDTSDDAETGRQTVQLVRQGKADLIMKGSLNTSVLLRAVLHKEEGLQNDGLITTMALAEVPGYHKILCFSDGGVIPYPTLEQKKKQIQLVTDVCHTWDTGMLRSRSSVPMKC
jgi:phosphate butyryltransferase